MSTELLLEGQVAEMLNRSVHTLRRWRREGRGPNFIKVEGRVLYPRRFLVSYLRSRPMGGGTIAKHPGHGEVSAGAAS